MAKKNESEPKADQPPNEKREADICFVIMPFGGWNNHYYLDIFRPAIEDAGLTPRRADDIFRPGTIVNDIWACTKEAKIILADLTGKNANVLYELGLAHAIAKPAILVTESIEDIPFDLRALRVIEYDKNAPNWGDILKQAITESIKETMEAPLKSILPTFLEVDEIAKPEVSPYEKEFLEIRQEIELLKREVRGSRVGLPFPPTTGLVDLDAYNLDAYNLDAYRRAIPTARGDTLVFSSEREAEEVMELLRHSSYDPFAIRVSRESEKETDADV